MKKLGLCGLTVLLVIAVCGMAQAMGPIIIGPHTLAWDANPAADNVTGYYVYWRVPPATTWLNTNRKSVASSPTPTLDLTTAGLASSNYEICVTAYNANAESGPSNIVPFAYITPVSPGGARLQ